jgi:multisubunit Na+/H+ antiporter MnhF subunit
MTLWLLASLGFMVALAPCAAVTLRGEPVDRLVGLEMGAIVLSLTLVCLAEAEHRIAFYDLGLAMAMLAFGGALVFARFLERWL